MGPRPKRVRVVGTVAIAGSIAHPAPKPAVRHRHRHQKATGSFHSTKRGLRRNRVDRLDNFVAARKCRTAQNPRTVPEPLARAPVRTLRETAALRIVEERRGPWRDSRSQRRGGPPTGGPADRPASRSFQFMMALKPSEYVPCVCQRQKGRMANITT